MKAIFEWALLKWTEHWGNGFYQILFLAAMVYLGIWIYRRKDRSIKSLMIYLLLMLFLFFCPITSKIIRKCIGKSVYWRVLWLLPIIPVIALAATDLLKKCKKKSIRCMAGILLTVLIAFSGQDMISAGNYAKVTNFQKVPDEVAVICETMKSHADGKQILVAADDHLASYIRVYDPSIYMAYGRKKRGAISKDARRLYDEICAVEKDYKKIAKLGKKVECNYLIVAVTEEQQKSVLKKYGYEEIGMVNQYGIFSLTM